jgi:hypothetical protein
MAGVSWPLSQVRQDAEGARDAWSGLKAFCDDYDREFTSMAGVSRPLSQVRQDPSALGLRS